MAKRSALIPAWALSLDRMIASNVRVMASCTRCREFRDLDLVALRDRVGGTYSLVNRRCPCRLTPGCKGWNRFHYMHGVMRPLSDDDTWARWLLDRER